MPNTVRMSKLPTYVTALVLIFVTWFLDTFRKSFVMVSNNNNHNSDGCPSAFLGCVCGGGAMNELCSLGTLPEESRWQRVHSLPIFLARLPVFAGLGKDGCVFKGTLLPWGHPFRTCVPLICTWKNPSLCIQMPNCNANRHLCAQLPILCVCKTDVPANSAGVSW